MSKTGGVFSMGSGGTTYEHNVQAAFVLAMLLNIEILREKYRKSLFRQLVKALMVGLNSLKKADFVKSI